MADGFRSQAVSPFPNHNELTLFLCFLLNLIIMRVVLHSISSLNLVLHAFKQLNLEVIQRISFYVIFVKLLLRRNAEVLMGILNWR